MECDLELDKAVAEIKRLKAKTVCIQMAEGLRPKVKEVVDFIKKNTNAKVLIWADSCFGACDIPQLDVDLLIHIGHSRFSR